MQRPLPEDAVSIVSSEPIAVLVLTVLAGGSLAAQSASPPRAVAAGHVAADLIALDGRLDEPAWASASPARGFVQREPNEGSPAADDTEVRFLLTDGALLVGARMHSATPGAIRPLVGRRDSGMPTEELFISFDTRRDRVTAYSFSVTPGGTRGDLFHPSDNLGSQDESWDPVWEVHTAIDSGGWTAEVRIPLTQLRFDAGEDQAWGVNLIRTVPTRNETSYWVLVGRSETGWASRMGSLTGLGSLRAPRRLEFVPYTAFEGTRAGTVDPGDPFSRRTSGTWRAGADLKLGLGPSLTLDATINPDFGQVEADPAVVNLSAFETFFDERRPFFVEGSNLFGGRNTFYSRRIGAAPAGSVDAAYAESAGNSTILGATKVTGRVPSGLSVGALTALTARERVRSFDPATGFGDAIVAPATGFAIVTAQQELGRDRSTVKASVTAVHRDVDIGSPLGATLARRAYTGLLDSRWRWAGGRYDVSAFVVGSRVEGSPEAILAQQRSSRRYFQRPDADHVTLDPTRTSLSGIFAGINHSKMAGNWLWDVDYEYSAPGVELNDLGFQGSADYHFIGGNVRHRQTRPGSLFHNWTLGVEQSSIWNTGGVHNFAESGVFGEVTWKNFWSSEFAVEYSPRAFDDGATRGGPLMEMPAEWRFDLEAETRSSERTLVEAFFSGSRDDLDGWEAEFGVGVRFRPGTRWQVSLEPSISRSVNARQYVTARPGGPPATYGTRYLFARIDRSEVAAQLRASVAITPELTFEGYVEPFASSGQYTAFGELAAARTLDLRRYGTDGTSIVLADGRYTVTDGAEELGFGDPDFNIRSFRSNLVLRWEWRPGSTAYLVWQQDRFEARDPGRRVGPGGLFQALGARGDNVIALKISYWLAR
jgi:hypothetical protein